MTNNNIQNYEDLVNSMHFMPDNINEYLIRIIKSLDNAIINYKKINSDNISKYEV